MNDKTLTFETALASADGNVAALAWRDAWRLQARNHPWMSAGLGLALVAVALLLSAGIRDGLSGGGEPLRLAMLGGLAGFGATALGALAGVVLRRLSARAEDSLLGFAAGMMLAASSFSLILPGLAAAREMTGSGPQDGTSVSPCCWNHSSVSPLGERPEPL